MLVLIPFFAVVAAVLGYRALAATPPNTAKFKAALWVLAAPWILTVLQLAPYLPTFGFKLLVGGVEGSGHVIWSSPIIGAALLTGRWLRRRDIWRPSGSPAYQAWLASRERRDETVVDSEPGL
jgi:hypothetical protein